MLFCTFLLKATTVASLVIVRHFTADVLVISLFSESAPVSKS